MSSQPPTGQPPYQPPQGQPQPGQPQAGQHPYAYGQQPHHQYQASRSTMILVFGILSLVVCQLFGPFAWSMGTDELRKIDQGLVSPQDRGSVQAGRICGIIGTALMIFTAVVFLGFFLLAASASSHY